MGSEQCSLCGTQINPGATACAGCGAVKKRYMTPPERGLWRFLIVGSIAVVMLALFFGSRGAANASLFLPPIMVVGWIWRYATRKEYWLK